MKTRKNLLLVTILSTTLFSCGNSITNQEANSEGFAAIEKEIKTKFGEEAYFTDLVISYDKSMGNMVSTTVTQNPESLKMGEWTCIQGAWKQVSEVTLEIPKGSNASDFMFQLNEEIKLSKLGELIEKSKENLSEEKEIKNPTLDMALIKYPDNGDASKAEYSIMLEPENGGTTFSYYYTITGDFIRTHY